MNGILQLPIGWVHKSWFLYLALELLPAMPAQSLLSSTLDVNVSIILQLSLPLPHTGTVLAVVLSILKEHKVVMKDNSTDIGTVPAAYKQ